MNPVHLGRSVRFVIVLASTLLLFLSIYYIAKVTYPFIIGLAIAFLINPLVHLLETKAKFPRPLSVFVSIIFLLSIFAGVITLLIAEIVSGAEYLASVVPQHVDTIIQYMEEMIAAQIIPFYERGASLLQSLGTGQKETILANIEETGQKIASSAGDFLQDFFLKLPNLVSWIPNFATVLIFSLLAAFFISNDWDKHQQKMVTYLPVKATISLQRVFSALKKALFGFIRAQMTLISLTTIIVLIGLLIMRVDYAITIALVAGLVDILPYLGTGTVFVPWIIYELIAGETSMAIGLSVIYIIVIVQRQIMEPKVLSASIGLDPLATLISLFVGFKLIGFLGLIVGPVVLVIIKSLHSAGIFTDLWGYIIGKDIAPPEK